MLLQGLTGEASQRFTFMAMALVVGSFMVNLAAGLVLYIMLSTVLGVLQSFIQKKWKAA
jgi:membrane protein insertase Oxa1/YidC/SpoIIIJ